MLINCKRLIDSFRLCDAMRHHAQLLNLHGKTLLCYVCSLLIGYVALAYAQSSETTDNCYVIGEPSSLLVIKCSRSYTRRRLLAVRKTASASGTNYKD